MHVNQHTALPKLNLPGLEHQTLASHRDGLKSFEVWRQKIGPHATTPVHCHDCEEVIVILSGQGECRFEDKVLAFKADETLVIPSSVVHQICNTGDQDLNIVATLAMSPVRVRSAEGAPMPLPWDA
ncbi:MAG: cupin domain-containing protein [Gammaproteobacteria bacterium]|nr:cupin domain-containing protein [Gammaproteobacteria bacterium]